MNGLTLDETALDLFARRPTRSFSTGLEFLDAPTARHDSAAVGYRPRQVVELCGPVDAPKTEVLMHVMAAFLTRSASDQQPKERVYLFDHECEVSVSRLRAILSARLIGDKQEHAVDEALKRVQVCRCRDSFQWLATLNHIHFQLLEAASGPLMLAFNCVGSFHAIDKMTAKSVGDGLALSEQVFLFLKQFIRHHSPIIFAAKETSSMHSCRMRFEGLI
ncbi:hypothetical protein PHYBOEH_007275 [Phytophthora boehmeriae]|uniref:DNA recombination and repair protein Rad51-like C-terminal domain-containing protein n=1 Tax=Phytophthora boehmeriae TaxID=109152 RepID=A0A8T1X8N3_9STRA|nr:hypothetical protein PHYBOEH_007275 [Phytophthora boehmeriae]